MYPDHSSPDLNRDLRSEPASEPGPDIDLIEGTDPAVVLPAARSDDTQVAEIPQRPTSPGTEFIRFYTPSSADFEGVEAWPEVRPAAEVLTRSATNPGTLRTPRERWIRSLTFIGVTFALVAVIAGSVYSVLPDLLEDHGGPVEEPTQPEEPVEPPAGPPPRAPSEIPARPPAVVEQPPARGLDAEELLKTTVQQVNDEQKLVDVAIGGPIDADKVTVVNLWATWCKPCKRELQGIKGMFEEKEASWQDQVRFVPLQVSDPRDAVWARQQFGGMMPRQMKYFLSDPRSRGGVLDVLREMAKPSRGDRPDGVKLPKKPSDIALPVTLVFDCQRDVRLFHVGELLASDFEALRGLLDTLRGELGTKFCAVRRQRSAARTQQESRQPPRAECGNGRCEEPEEDAKNCCDCYPCQNPRDKCTHPSGGQPRCVPRSIH